MLVLPRAQDVQVPRPGAQQMRCPRIEVQLGREYATIEVTKGPVPPPWPGRQIIGGQIVYLSTLLAVHCSQAHILACDNWSDVKTWKPVKRQPTAISIRDRLQLGHTSLDNPPLTISGLPIT